MLSLSPRYDLYKFNLPKEFLPDEVYEKWAKILAKEPGVFVTPIEYLNESIKGISLPGISDINIQQTQHSYNSIERKNGDNYTMGRLNVEPKQDNTYVGSSNPLDKINRELKVDFRLNQGLFNYYMIYETIFYRMCKPILYDKGLDFDIDLLNEDGTATSRIKIMQAHLDGIDGIDLSMDKVDRQSDTFSVTWKFNNIDFDVLPNDSYIK